MRGLEHKLKTTMLAGLMLASSCFAAQPTGTSQPRASEAELQDLKSLDQLREHFNNDAGKIRLLLLLSPT